MNVRDERARVEGYRGHPSGGLGSAKLGMARVALFGSSLAASWVLGCGGAPLPPPEETTREFAAAVEVGDAKAVHALLDEASRERLTESDVARMLAAEAVDLKQRARGLTTGATTTTVTLRYPGELLTLRLTEGRLEVLDVTTLALGASSAEQALVALKDALGRRDLPLLLRLLGREPGARVVDELRALEQSLEGLDGAAYERRGERVFVLLPDGRTIELSDRDGTFRVEGFE